MRMIIINVNKKYIQIPWYNIRYNYKLCNKRVINNYILYKRKLSGDSSLKELIIIWISNVHII